MRTGPQSSLEKCATKSPSVRMPTRAPSSTTLLLAARTDHPLMRRGARSLLARLVKRNVSVREYARAMMHAKVAVVDSEWAIVGSSNLDRQSLEHSYEVNLILEGGDIPDLLRARFDRDFEESEAVTEASLAARGPLERLVDAFASLLLRLV